MSSVGSRVAAPFFGPYSASKRALNAIADAWRRELAPWGIRVSVLVVAPVATPIWAKAAVSLDEVRRGLPPRGIELYGEALAELADYVGTTASATAIDTGAVVRAARRAIAGKRPRPTYLVGCETRVGLVLSGILPERMFGAVLRRRMR